jgi:hypothetical protein
MGVWKAIAPTSSPPKFRKLQQNKASSAGAESCTYLILGSFLLRGYQCYSNTFWESQNSAISTACGRFRATLSQYISKAKKKVLVGIGGKFSIHYAPALFPYSNEIKDLRTWIGNNYFAICYFSLSADFASIYLLFSIRIWKHSVRNISSINSDCSVSSA